MRFIIFDSTAGTDDAGKNFVKTYWFPPYLRATWLLSKAHCNAQGMKFVSIDSQAEADYFIPHIIQNLALIDGVAHIGAIATIAKSPTEWYWVETSQKVSFTIPWAAYQPDNFGNNEMCMTIRKLTASTVAFNDIPCSESVLGNFICQTVSYV